MYTTPDRSLENLERKILDMRLITKNGKHLDYMTQQHFHRKTEKTRLIFFGGVGWVCGGYILAGDKG